MGWNLSLHIKVKEFSKLALTSLALVSMSLGAIAQHKAVSPAGTRTRASGTGATFYQCISNSLLTFGIGSGTSVAGSFMLETTANNPDNPNKTPVTLLFGGPVEAPNATPIATGSVLMVRVDGGKNSGGNGYDYIFGRQTEGTWLTVPTIAGNHIVARWQTLPVTVNTVVFDPKIEIDMTASFVHDQVRLEFNIINNGSGQSHAVGLVFVQDINAGTDDTSLGGPLRIPNGPYLHMETLLSGGQVPPYWDVFVLGAIPATGAVPGSRTLRGYLAPQNSGQTEPTRPSRFAFGDLNKLSGVNPTPPATVMGRDFDYVWNFQPDPRINLNSGAIDNAVAVYWDPQSVAPGQTLPIITYIGQSTADIDFSPPVALSVSGPLALGFQTLKDANGNSTGVTPSPTPFTINAFVQNLTDLSQSGGITISPVTVFLDLPKGLVLASGETNPKTILNVAPGQESSVSWQVTTDTSNPVNGVLRYTVTASPNIGNGKSVQRTVDVPAPPAVTLKGSNTTQGLYSMISFPLIFGNATPSSILGLNANQPSPDFDLVRYNPTSGHYEPVNTFVPGLSYWLRSRLAADKSVVIDATKYPPLDNQVQPNSSGYKINYPQGWNQIGDPNIYPIRFSEVQIFDQATLTLTDITTASDQLHQWIQPAVFFYDTSDANPQNWNYVLENGFGFDMEPYQGYWILVKRAGLQFIYPGVDVPGASVTRAAKIGVGLGSTGGRSTVNNWVLKINARGTISTDRSTTIGVAPKATDNADYYKLNKPPVQENQLSLDIVHSDWTDGGRYAQDLRSPAQNRKTWNMMLTSSKPNEAVTLSWPDVAANVPRNYRLTMIDVDSNQRYDLRHSSSVVVTTNANKTRNVQFVAEPTRGSGPALITSFDVVQNGSRAIGSVSSVSINYALSESADTRIYIRSGNGRTLRTLTGTTRAAGDNAGTAVWDLRDSKGAGIPSGVYNVELVAQGASGQVSRQVRPFVLAR